MTVQNKKVKTTILAVLMTAVHAFAQIQAPPQPEAKGSPSPPIGLPIDNEVILLFIVAMIYGVYKIVRRSKKAA